MLEPIIEKLTQSIEWDDGGDYGRLPYEEYDAFIRSIAEQEDKP